MTEESIDLLKFVDLTPNDTICIDDNKGGVALGGIAELKGMSGKQIVVLGVVGA